MKIKYLKQVVAGLLLAALSALPICASAEDLPADTPLPGDYQAAPAAPSAPVRHHSTGTVHHRSAPGKSKHAQGKRHKAAKAHKANGHKAAANKHGARKAKHAKRHMTAHKRHPTQKHKLRKHKS